MKKHLFLLICISLFFSYKSSAVPKWLSEMFGCTWTWSGDATLTGSDGGMCSYDRPMSGHSWLWGSCGSESYSYTIPCDADANFIPVPKKSYVGTMAQKMGEIEAMGYNINPSWKDPEELSNDNVQREAVTFRLKLAGYELQDSWLTLEEEPCPVPAPTVDILLAQDHTFINDDCANENVIISPNPNDGRFTLKLDNYKDALSVEIIRVADMSSVWSKAAPLSNTIDVSLSSPIVGTHVVRIITKTSVIYRNILVK